MPQSRLHAMLLEGCICNSGIPAYRNSDEGDCSGADDARHRKHDGCNGLDDVQVIACFFRGRNSLVNPGAFPV
ncbi:hypothetical protein A7K73_00130 [Candidatus Methylacidiphilum fumarolicum]|nr:hypothetical protein A7K73_00130 [Candidatus Methylacidiphilum fumarolicum]TFE76855.1 hypothetical protein A7D33_07980 [Candidatus Methylacidiphilum fumarolicum]